jgi:8-oxo-dGTP diphosphatase
MNELPKVGVTVLIVKDGKYLLGRRMGNMIAASQFQTPGGHLENGESIIGCAIREIKEETDLEIENVHFACLSNVTDFPPHHYVMVCLVADWKSGESKNCETDKCMDWEWYAPDALPSPLTPATRDVIKSHQSKELLFDSSI